MVDSSLQTVGLFAKADKNDTPAAQSKPDAKEGLVESKKPSEDEFGKGVVLYLKNDVVVGCLMWNIFKKTSIARQVLFYLSLFIFNIKFTLNSNNVLCF